MPRLEEEADFRAARELFGGGSSGGSQLDSLLPKTLKDFEQYAELLTNRCAGVQYWVCDFGQLDSLYWNAGGHTWWCGVQERCAW